MVNEVLYKDTIKPQTYRQIEFDSIHRSLKGPGKVVFP